MHFILFTLGMRHITHVFKAMCSLISNTENYCMTQWVMSIIYYIGVGAWKCRKQVWAARTFYRMGLCSKSETLATYGTSGSERNAAETTIPDTSLRFQVMVVLAGGSKKGDLNGLWSHSVLWTKRQICDVITQLRKEAAPKLTSNLGI